jgi:transposase
LEDGIMHAKFATCQTVLALDVGKASHWAVMAARSGEVLDDRPVANRERDLDELFASAPEGTLVVDQKRNVGALALRRARMAGLAAGYLPGLAAHEASKLFAGDPRTEAARSMAAQREHMVSCATRDKNRLRSILLESCPAFEALADLSDPHWLDMLASLGGPWGILDAGKASLGAVTRGANRAKVDAAWEAAASSTRPSEWQVAAENPQVRMLARRISEAVEEAARLDAEIAALLDGDATYACLLTVPGIGPRTASELAISIDVADFPDHDHLASCCGIAPRNRQSGSGRASLSSIDDKLAVRRAGAQAGDR